MKKLTIILLSSLVFSGCSLRNLLLKKPAGLEISTAPKSTVFIGGDNLGETPYSNNNIKPGTYQIKLIPDSPDGSLVPWEGEIVLTPQTTTIISRTFAPNEPESASHTLLLKPDADRSQAFVSVVSDPDTSSVTLDGSPHGFTPISKLAVEEGEHTLEVASPGFKPVTIGFKASRGYNLIVDVKLARDTITLEFSPPATPSGLETSETQSPSPLSSSPSSTSSSSPSPSSAITPPYVIIEETGTGWLRVRSSPDSSEDNEIGKASVGDKFKYLESNPSGWHKIIFESQEGWISGKYATVVK